MLNDRATSTGNNTDIRRFRYLLSLGAFDVELNYSEHSLVLRIDAIVCFNPHVHKEGGECSISDAVCGRMSSDRASLVQ